MYSLESRQGCSRVDFLCHRNHRSIKGKTRCSQRACLGLHILSYPESQGFLVCVPKASSFLPRFEYVLLLIFLVSELGRDKQGSGCLWTGVCLWVASHMRGLVCSKIWLCRGFPGGSVVRNTSVNVGDARDMIWSLGRPLEKEMRTHSSILVWRIPWTEEPGGLQSMRSQRVGHGSATQQQRGCVALSNYSRCILKLWTAYLQPINPFCLMKYKAQLLQESLTNWVD